MCDSLPQRSLHYSDSEVLYTCVANNGSALHRSQSFLRTRYPGFLSFLSVRDILEKAWGEKVRE